MGSIRKQSILGSIALYAGQVVGLANKMVLFPLVFAGQEQYWGMLAFMLGVAALLGGIGTLGFGKAILRYVPKSPERARWIIQRSLLYSGLGGVVSVAVVAAMSEGIAQFSSDFSLFGEFAGLLLLLLVGQWFFEMGSSVFAAFYKAQYGLMANNVTFRITQSVLLLACYFGGLSISHFLWLNGLAYALNHLVLFVLSLRWAHRFSASPTKDPAEPMGLSAYAAFMVVLTLVSQAFLQLDALMVGHFLLLSQLAYFDLAKNLSSVMDLPTRALGASSVASLSRLLGASELAKVKEVYQKASFVQLLLGLFMFAAIITHIDWLIARLPSADYAVIKPLFLVIALGKMIDLATGLNWAIISNSERYWINLQIGTATLIALVGLEWWLIPEFGLVGAAWGIVAAYALNNALRTYFVWNVFGMGPLGRDHRKLLPMIAVAVAASIDFPLDRSVQMILKDLAIGATLWWYAQPGRTIAEWDDLLGSVKNRWAVRRR